MGFTSNIKFEDWTEKKFKEELLRIRNGITFIVMHYVNLFVDTQFHYTNIIRWLKELNLYHSQKEESTFIRIRLKSNIPHLSHFFCLIDLMFGKIYLDVMQGVRVLAIDSNEYKFSDSYKEFSLKIKEIGEECKTDAFVRLETPEKKINEYEQLLVFGFMEELKLQEISISSLKTKINNIGMGSLDSIMKFNESQFFKR
jgi:hypothetical protein